MKIKYLQNLFVAVCNSLNLHCNGATTLNISLTFAIIEGIPPKRFYGGGPGGDCRPQIGHAAVTADFENENDHVLEVGDWREDRIESRTAHYG